MFRVRIFNSTQMLQLVLLRSNFLFLSEIRKNKHTIFSGIQPTGVPHLGNYFGAIQKWISLQNENNSCYFSVVDLHSITIPQEPHKLRYNIQLMTASLLASGIDPDRSVLFLQSQVPQHTELAKILGSLTTFARLSHLPQYKEKSSNCKEISLGLYLYPILQSADILLYKATHVPVGLDQIQHIQLAQHLAKLFNNKYKIIFPIPSALIDDTTAKIKSLCQPLKKMSKSDSDENSRIELTDEQDIIFKKIIQMQTDASSVIFDKELYPGIANLILMHSLCSGLSCSKICEENTNIDIEKYKTIVAEVIIEYLKPLQSKIKQLLSEPSYLSNVLNTNSEKAQQLASETIKEVKDICGQLL